MRSNLILPGASKRRIVGGAWAPTDEPLLHLWTSPRDVATITDAGGGAVSQINDKSATGINLTQGNAAARPLTGTRTINGLNVLEPDGADDRLNATYAPPSTLTCVFMVAPDAASLSSQRVILRCGGSSRFAFRTVHVGGAFYLDMFGAGNVSGGLVNGFFSAGTPVIASLVFDLPNNNWRAYKNGQLIHTETDGYQTAFNAERITYFSDSNPGDSFFDGVGGDIEIYATAADDPRQKAEGELAHAYGVTLVAGHPYELSPP